MLVFIDDSGDPGFRLGKGSSSHFVIACIIFDDDLEALKVKVAVKDLKRELKFPDDVEFKFFKSRNVIKESFLKSIDKFNFKVRAIVVDKTIIRSDELKNNKNSFYSYIIKSVLENSNDSILDARIRIDGSGDRFFRKNFLSYLRRQLDLKQKRIMKNCKLVDSKSDELIQVADMVAGCIRRSYDKSKNDPVYYKSLIKKHIEDEWEFR
jgi:hypothetical protein